MQDDNKSYDYNDLGLFRYGIIAPVLTQTHNFKSDNAYFEFASTKEYEFNNRKYKFTKSAIKKWYFQYKKGGFEKLQARNRSDKGKSRKLSEETIEKIISIREEYPSITGKKMYDILNKEGYIKKKLISLDALLYFLKNNNLKATQSDGIERRSYEHEFSNTCWQADTTNAVYLNINGVKYRTYIIMFVDDKSRLITGIDVFLNDNALNMQKVLKEAVKTYGIPKQLFVDNGGPYSNKQLAIICATLGIKLIHARPYSGASKGKCERLFQTIKNKWMRCIDWNTFKSLDDIRGSLKNFLNDEYQNEIHSITKQRPNERWHADYNQIRFLDESFIDVAFLHQETRKVRLDRTVHLNNQIYEVPYKYVSKNITIKYNPLDNGKIWIFENNELKEECKLINKIDNSKIKRKKAIDYSKVVNNDLDVKEWEEK